MMTRVRVRTSAALLGVLTVAVLVAGVFHPAVKEQWHLWRLESDDETVRRAAAASLARLQSVRAIPRLFELLTESPVEEGSQYFPLVVPERIVRRHALRGAAGIALPADGLSDSATDHDELGDVIHAIRRRARASLPNNFALDALIEISRPVLEYAETLDIAPDDLQARFVRDELRHHVAGGQEPGFDSGTSE